MELTIQYFWVGLAGCAGAILRVAIGKIFGRWITVGFPFATMFINVSGSLFLGWFATAVRERFALSPTVVLAIGSGFVGAYTTFSTFMYETNDLALKGSEIRAALNLLVSLVLGLAAIRLGIFLARRA